MKRSISVFIISILLFTSLGLAQEPVNQEVVSRIKVESFQNSKVMEIVSYLTDVYGPRLTGSPNLKAASEWSRSKLTEWGLANARLEPWGKFGNGWSVKKYSVEMIEPQYLNLIAVPKAWTPGTNGTVSGKPVLVQISSPADFAKFRGKLKGAIVLNGRPLPATSRFEPFAKRLTEQELAAQATATDPGSPKNYVEEDKEWKGILARQDEITKFFRDEGIAVLLEPSRSEQGVVRVGTQSYRLDPAQTFPALVLAKEHYGRLVRLLEKGIAAQLAVNVETVTHDQDTTGYNVIAELPGTDPKLRDEIVMIGGHLDSWHAGTGATDNAAGCAAMMEALRILKVIGVKPRRTIRVALWSGEEQGYFGSLGYVRKHFGDPDTGKLLPGHEKLAAYFNMDHGTGKIRGVYLQGNEAVRPIFEAYLKPFIYLGATTLSAQNTGGTDHMPFVGLGLPGFQFIQDPIEYTSRTHHTNMDVYEAVIEDDLQQAAAIIATFAYHTAMRDEKLPRPVWTKPQS